MERQEQHSNRVKRCVLKFKPALFFSIQSIKLNIALNWNCMRKRVSNNWYDMIIENKRVYIDEFVPVCKINLTHSHRFHKQISANQYAIAIDRPPIQIFLKIGNFPLKVGKIGAKSGIWRKYSKRSSFS